MKCYKYKNQEFTKEEILKQIKEERKNFYFNLTKTGLGLLVPKTKEVILNEGSNLFGIDRGESSYNLKYQTIDQENQVKYALKAIESIQNNIDKVNRWFNQIGNTDVFWNKVQQDLKIPKEQVNLLKESEGNTIGEKLTSFAANYSYTVEINTAKEKPKTEYGTSYYIKEGYFYQKNDEGFFKQLEGRNNPLIEISKEEYEEYQGSNTQHYSNLTVPGGTNYTENEIATPAITPSIKGHAQFATDNGIGWFRSDDKHPFTGFLEDLIASGTIKKVPCG